MRTSPILIALMISVSPLAWSQAQNPSPETAPAPPAPQRSPDSRNADLAVPLCPAKFDDGLDKDGIAVVREDGVTAPKPTHIADAEMTEEGRMPRPVDFAVLVSAIVDVDGSVRDVCLRRSAGLGLDANAADTVRKYRFTPATKDGKPVPVRIGMRVTFKAY
jgi:TonB family protein